MASETARRASSPWFSVPALKKPPTQVTVTKASKLRAPHERAPVPPDASTDLAASWWISAPRTGFSAVATVEAKRMKGSKEAAYVSGMTVWGS